jgi:hypothetical protein
MVNGQTSNYARMKMKNILICAPEMVLTIGYEARRISVLEGKTNP